MCCEDWSTAGPDCAELIMVLRLSQRLLGHPFALTLSGLRHAAKGPGIAACATCLTVEFLPVSMLVLMLGIDGVCAALHVALLLPARARLCSRDLQSKALRFGCGGQLGTKTTNQERSGRSDGIKCVERRSQHRTFLANVSMPMRSNDRGQMGRNTTDRHVPAHRQT